VLPGLMSLVLVVQNLYKPIPVIDVEEVISKNVEIAEIA
jgi:hypothetical protein